MPSPSDAARHSADKQSEKKGFPHESPSGGLNLVVCVLSVVCVTASVYNGWRESVLESRLRVLETRFALFETRDQGGLDSVDVVLERFRRDADGDKSTISRTGRDVPECVCPAGRNRHILLEAQIKLSFGTCFLRKSDILSMAPKRYRASSRF